KLALRLNPASLGDPQCWPTLAINLAFIFAMSSATYQIRYNMDRLILSGQYRATLYQITLASYNLFFPMINILIMIYFLFIGPRIVHLLDSSCFRTVAPSPANSKRLTLAIVLFDYVSFGAIYGAPFKRYLSWPPQLLTLLMPVFMYLVHTTPLVVLILIGYYKYATYRCVMKLEDDLRRDDAPSMGK